MELNNFGFYRAIPKDLKVPKVPKALIPKAPSAPNNYPPSGRHRKRHFQILEKCNFYVIINLEKCKKIEIFTLEKCILFAFYACI